MTLPTIPLHINDCYLRNLKISDAEQYRDLLYHPNVQPYIPNANVPTSLFDSIRRLHILRSLHYAKQGAVWGIYNSDNSLIGCVGFDTYSSIHQRLDIAFELHPDYQKKGIMSTAISHVLQFGFEQLEANRIQAYTLSDNHPSIQLLKRSGFTQEGLLKHFQVFNDKVSDIVIFGITK
jgi:ribosomal-protein-alanine N-acetyltransferase